MFFSSWLSKSFLGPLEFIVSCLWCLPLLAIFFFLTTIFAFEKLAPLLLGIILLVSWFYSVHVILYLTNTVQYSHIIFTFVTCYFTTFRVATSQEISWLYFWGQISPAKKHMLMSVTSNMSIIYKVSCDRLTSGFCMLLELLDMESFQAPIASLISIFDETCIRMMILLSIKRWHETTRLVFLFCRFVIIFYIHYNKYH